MYTMKGMMNALNVVCVAYILLYQHSSKESYQSGDTIIFFIPFPALFFNKNQLWYYRSPSLLTPISNNY